MCWLYQDETWSIELFEVSNVILRLYSDSELFGVTMELWETKTHLLTLCTIGPDERQIPAEKHGLTQYFYTKTLFFIAQIILFSGTESFDWN